MIRPLVATTLVLGFASRVYAQGPDSLVAPWRGIRELRVVVESLHASSGRAGFVPSQIQGDFERELRAIGIAIAASSSRGPYLYLRVTIRQDSDSGFPFLVELLLRDSVRLVRDTTIRTRATTWTRNRGGYLVYADHAALGRDVRDAIQAMVERFGDDWKVANSRR